MPGVLFVLLLLLLYLYELLDLDLMCTVINVTNTFCHLRTIKPCETWSVDPFHRDFLVFDIFLAF